MKPWKQSRGQSMSDQDELRDFDELRDRIEQEGTVE